MFEDRKEPKKKPATEGRSLSQAFGQGGKGGGGSNGDNSKNNGGNLGDLKFPAGWEEYRREKNQQKAALQPAPQTKKQNQQP